MQNKTQDSNENTSFNLDNISGYRLTLIGGAIVVVLSVGFVEVFGTSDAAKAYAAFVATAAVPLLLTLFKAEQNGQQQTVRHEQNQQAIAQLVNDNVAVKRALLSIQDNSMTVDEAAHAAAQAIQPDIPVEGEKQP